MDSSEVRIVFRHLTGARATEVDVVPLGAHRELILGRAPSAAVRFDPHRDREVGRHHARIEPGAAAGELRIADLGSINGTFVNGRRIASPAPLRAGDVVQFGADGPSVEIGVEVLAAPRGRVSSSGPAGP